LVGFLCPRKQLKLSLNATITAKHGFFIVTSKLIHSTTLFQGGQLHADAWALLTPSGCSTGVGAGWSSLEADSIEDGTGQVLHAGFFDTHCHGGGGYSANRGLTDIKAILDYNQEHQVSRNLISLVSAEVADMVEIAESARALAEDKRFIGLHFEGPFLAAAYCGAQNPKVLKNPTDAELEAIIAPGTVKSMTIAPELFTEDQLRLLARANIKICFGHSEGNYDQARVLFESFPGSVMTHTFNAMLPIHHRAAGPIPAALETETFMELIADGIHVEPSVARLIPKDSLILVTDAIEAAGSTEGHYLLGGLEVSVQNGIARTKDGNLAGSTLAMDDAVKNYASWSEDDLAAMKAAITNPEQAYGVSSAELSIDNYFLISLPAANH
jgi:N-acetylglucosamine-6-phosphate deacetylase